MQTKEEHIEISSEDTPVPKFNIGDLAVYPAHGVGRIEAIENRTINGGIQSFYIMKILENSMTIMIPVQNVSSVGLRNILSENEIPTVYAIMKDRNTPQDNQTWNRRYREYMEKIKTGSLFEVAGVYRDLFLLRLTKELSFGERKLFDTAQSLLVKELSIARQCDEKNILDEMNALFEPDIQALKESQAPAADESSSTQTDPKDAPSKPDDDQTKE